MFGKNEVRPQDLSKPNELRVKEIFYTIQGEGPYNGMPAVFIRMAGCNLKCWFCDTDFETDTHIVSPAEIVSLTRLLQPHGLVVITGGEPLAQDISVLCRLLAEFGYRIQIETAGTVWVPGLAGIPVVEFVCSPKTGKVHDEIAARCGHWKYIIRDGEQDPVDGLPAASTQIPGKEKRLYRTQSGMVYIQPMDEHDDEKNARNNAAVARTAMRFGYRASIQMHKILGVD